MLAVQTDRQTGRQTLINFIVMQHVTEIFLVVTVVDRNSSLVELVAMDVTLCLCVDIKTFGHIWWMYCIYVGLWYTWSLSYFTLLKEKISISVWERYIPIIWYLLSALSFSYFSQEQYYRIYLWIWQINKFNLACTPFWQSGSVLCDFFHFHLTILIIYLSIVFPSIWNEYALTQKWRELIFPYLFV